MLLNELNERRLPDVLALSNGEKADDLKLWSKRRTEILDILKSEIYGYSPPEPKNVIGTVKQCDTNAFAGKALHSVIDIQFDTPKGEFSFPVNLIIPKKNSSVPLFLHIAFRPDIPDRLYPVEEIIDGGFATASFYYEDIALDIDDCFRAKMAGMFAGKKREPGDWGKISMWAWAASRVMDYLQTVKEVDKERIAVIGHSRLGKTALWCAAQDERFSMGVSNNSGCSGAAITRGKKGEQIKDITKKFSYWFCQNYRKYSDNEENMPFDQHFLLAAVAPRPVYVSSAMEDEWADPISEFLACAAADRVYGLSGLKGLGTPDEFPQPGTVLHEGKIGYHLREGTHFLSRFDWQCFMKYMEKHT